MTVKTWDQAKEVTIIKWENILKKLQDVKEKMNISCGFCELGLYLGERTDQFMCYECDSIAKTLCEKYLTINCEFAEPLDKTLEKASELLERIKAMKPGN